MTYCEAKEEREETKMAENGTVYGECAVNNSAGGNIKALIGDTDPFQINLSVDVVILNIPLTAVIEKHADGSMELLIMPQRQTQTDRFTLADLISGINGAFKSITGSDMFKLDTDAVKDKLGGLLESVEGISVALQQVFLHVRYAGDDSSDVSLEYAFCLKITSKTPETKGFDFAEIQSVSFGIWNTKRESILSEMGLTSISELIGD